MVLEHGIHEFSVKKLVFTKCIVHFSRGCHVSRCFSHLTFLLLSLVICEYLFLLINEPLLPFDVLEHVLVLGQHEVVREHLGVLLIEFKHLGQSGFHLWLSVSALQEFAHIIIYQVVFEDRYKTRGFIIDYVIDDFSIVVLSGGHVFLLQGLGYYTVLDF